MKIRVLFAVKASIVSGANRAMEDTFGPSARNTFTVSVVRSGVTWYIACGVFEVEGLKALKGKIKTQIAAGNAKVWTRAGRVKLAEEGYLYVHE